MLQKMLGVCFFSTILVLSYVATLHIVTNKVDEIHQHITAAERARNVQLGGPVYLRPLSDHQPVSKKKYAVRKISTHKEPARKPGSVNKKHSKKKIKTKY